MNLPVRSGSFEADDADEARRYIAGVYAPIQCLALAGTRFHLKCGFASVGTVSFYRACSETNNRYVSESAFDGYLFALPVSGVLKTLQQPGRRLECRPDQAIVLDGRTLLEVTHSAQLQLNAIAISSQAMHTALSLALDMPVVERIEFSPHLPADSFVVRTVALLSQSFLEGLSGPAPLRGAPFALKRMKQTLINLLIESVPHNYSERLRKQPRLPAPRQIQAAIEFMRGRLTESISIADVANAVGRSQRALQVGFRRYQSMSPSAYLRSLRLRGTRDDLLQAASTATVADIAKRWGFLHLGVFAERYRSAFGELPSVTLRRGRGR